jgi:hypothetical protein
MDDIIFSKLKNNWASFKEGLIKLPIDVIDVWINSNIDEIISKMKETYTKGYNTFVDSEIVFNDAYTKEEIRVPVNIQKTLRSVNDTTEAAMYYDKKENAIYISAKTILENIKSADKIKQYIKNGIQHELTHIVDPGRKFKTQKHSSFSELINSDIEFPAFLRQYIELIKNKGNSIKVLNAIRKGQKIPIPEIAEWFSQLNDENKKKFIKELVKEVL